MALLSMDSFDHYATADLAEKWTVIGSGLSINATAGRRGSGSFRSTHSTNASASAISRTVPVSGSTAIIGVAVKMSVPPPAITALLQVLTGTTTQVTVRINPDLTLSVLRGAFSTGGTVLGVTSVALVAGVFAYVELKVLLHASAGTVDLRVNGVSVAPFPLTGLNTAQSGTAWSAFALGQYDGGAATGNAHTMDLDDLYVCDGSGSAPWNDLLGDCRVDVRNATGAGASSGWTPSAGANWQNVDDAAPNDDTDYNAAAAAGVTDTFVVEDAPSPGATIFGVQVNLSVKKSDAGACLIAPVVRHAGSDQVGAALAPATAYAYGSAVYQTNPGTGEAWTEAGFNAAEFGYKRTT